MSAGQGEVGTGGEVIFGSPRTGRSREALRQFAGRLPRAHGLEGHYWTIRSHLQALYTRTPPAPAQPWSGAVHDPELGAVALSGLWHAVPGARRALIVVHGLGGRAESPYLDAVARAARAAGVSTLRLSLRGAARDGADLYHAGSWRDVAAAAHSPELAVYPELSLVGYSLGGHVALSYAVNAGDARLRSVAAVCPPLDLALGALEFDRSAWIYRHHVLRSMKQMFRAVIERHGDTPPYSGIAWHDVARVQRIVDWDQLVIAPRHGFRDAFDYYRRESIGPRLSELPCRTLIVSAEHDPMVRFSTLEATFAACSAAEARSAPLVVRRLRRAGHLGFPSELDLGFGSAPGISPQLVHFLLAD
jgi:predicted alpha/beta-fold hydrolase